MLYTDKIHLVADTIEELHEFAKSIGIGRWYYEGVRKGHPHYDIPRKKLAAVLAQVPIVDKRKILEVSKASWATFNLYPYKDITDRVAKHFGNYMRHEELLEAWREFTGPVQVPTKLRYRKAFIKPEE